MSGAGLFAGEITQAAPVADAPTTKPRSYVWMEYGTPISEVVPTSGEGYAVTQDNFFGPTPSLAHPFANEVWDAITMTAVFRARDVISSANDQGIFNLKSTSGEIELFVRHRSIQDQTFFGFTISNTSGLITQGTHEITVDHPTWNDDHWYWMGISYSNTLNESKFAIVNFDAGEEAWFDATVSNNQQVSWGPSTTASSVVVWGAKSTGGIDVQGSEFPGPISQVLINDSYHDFSDQFTQFAGIDGVIDIGPTGNYPFGGTPEVYLPRGFPEGNLGTRFIGNPSDFFLENKVGTDEGLPPIAS